MKISRKKIVVAISIIFTASAINQSHAISPTGVKAKPQQILLDTGGVGGVEGANLPGVKWWFGETPNGKPFIFWSWSPNG